MNIWSVFLCNILNIYQVSPAMNYKNLRSCPSWKKNCMSRNGMHATIILIDILVKFFKPLFLWIWVTFDESEKIDLIGDTNFRRKCVCIISIGLTSNHEWLGPLLGRWHLICRLLSLRPAPKLPGFQASDERCGKFAVSQYRQDAKIWFWIPNCE
jgi:hypothetical protein